MLEIHDSLEKAEKEKLGGYYYTHFSLPMKKITPWTGQIRSIQGRDLLYSWKMIESVMPDLASVQLRLKKGTVFLPLGSKLAFGGGKISRFFILD